MPLREAQSRVPTARFLPLDEDTLAAVVLAFEAMLEALDAFSPTVESAPPDQLGAGRAVAYVDVSGLEALYGPEPEIAARLAAAAAEVGGGPAFAGIAAGKFVAWVAASRQPAHPPAPSAAAVPTARAPAPAAPRTSPATLVIPPGQEAAFLAPLALDTLPLALRTRQALHRLGIHTLGAFAGLPANAVRHRYGTAGLAAHALAKGCDDSPLRARRTAPSAGVAVAFEWEETDLDRLTFTVKGLADQLARRLLALDEGDVEAREPDADFIDESPPDSPVDHGEPWPEDSQLVDEESMDGDSAVGAGRAARLAAQRWRAPQPLPQRRPRQAQPPEKTPRFAAQALRVRWLLGTGEEREALIQLAEPAGTAAAFGEHLRWHLEGVDRLLMDQGTTPNEGTSPDHQPDTPGGLTYEPLDRRAGVTGIALEAVGIGLPSSTQLKLLAPLGRSTAEEGMLGRLDAATRARRAIARVRARWGPPAAQGAALTAARLPEARLQLTEPAIGLQVEAPAAPLALASFPSVRTHASPPNPDPAAPLNGELPMWLIDPPEPVAILTPRKGGRRVLVRRTPTRCPGQPVPKAPQQSRVVHFGGPWQVVDSRALAAHEPLRRDYYQVELEDGGAYLLFWDRVADRWFIQGIFT